MPMKTLLALVLLLAVGTGRADVVDFDADGVADTLVVIVGDSAALPSAGSVEGVSGSDGSSLFVVGSGIPEDYFGAALITSDPAGASRLVVSSPRGGELASASLWTFGADGTLMFELDAPPATRLGLSMSRVPDHDADGFEDILVQGAASVGGAWVEAVTLLSSVDSAILAQRYGDYGAIRSLLDAGEMLYVATDLNNDYRVDELDIAEFFVLGADSRADLNGDGEVTPADLAMVIDDYLAGRGPVSDGQILARPEAADDDFIAPWQAVFGDQEPVLHGEDAVGVGAGPTDVGCSTCFVRMSGLVNPMPGETVVVNRVATPSGGHAFWQLNDGPVVGPVDEFVLQAPSVGHHSLTLTYVTPDGCTCSDQQIFTVSECDVAFLKCGTRVAGVLAGIEAVADPKGGVFTFSLLSGVVSSFEQDGGMLELRSEDAQELIVEVAYELRGCVTTDICTVSMRDPSSFDVDADADGYPNGCEVLLGTNPNDPASTPDRRVDADRDGIPDVDEVCFYETDPLRFDTDRDGVGDWAELALNLNPLSVTAGDAATPEVMAADLDQDRLHDQFEIKLGLDPTRADMDSDGVLDGIEFRSGTDPNDPRSIPAPADEDGDGLDDLAELYLHFSDPANPDTDGDGLRDGWEVEYGLSPTSRFSLGDGVLDSERDSDGDGLSNLAEQGLGTSPFEQDSDRDGLSDEQEVLGLSDPLVAAGSVQVRSCWMDVLVHSPDRVEFTLGAIVLRTPTVAEIDAAIAANQAVIELEVAGGPGSYAHYNMQGAISARLQMPIGRPADFAVRIIEHFSGDPECDSSRVWFDLSANATLLYPGAPAQRERLDPPLCFAYPVRFGHSDVEVLTPYIALSAGSECPPEESVYAFTILPVDTLSDYDCNSASTIVGVNETARATVSISNSMDNRYFQDCADPCEDIVPADHIVRVADETVASLVDSSGIIPWKRFDSNVLEIELLGTEPGRTPLDVFYWPEECEGDPDSAVLVPIFRPWVDVEQTTAVDLALQIDTNNDGLLDDADGDPSGTTGSVIWVNSDDRDRDGVLDFGDGFNFDGEESVDDDLDVEWGPDGDILAEKGRFYPIRVSASTGDTIRFEYVASAPLAGRLDEENAFVAAPGDGRLWLRPQTTARDGRCVSEGGHFVVPGVEYAIDDLLVNGAGTIYYEAVRPSREVGDAVVRVVVGCGFECSKCVEARFTALDADLVPLDPYAVQTISRPSPVIAVESFDVQNVRSSPDGLAILADITVAGTVDDAASDLAAAPEGVVDQIAVAMNTDDARLHGSDAAVTIPVVVTKESDPASLLKPYDYSGSFSTTLVGVEVLPGVNHLTLEAGNLHSYRGYSQHRFFVTPIGSDGIAIDQHGVVALSLDLGVGGTWDLGASIDLRVEQHDETETLSLTSSGSTEYSDGTTSLRVEYASSEMAGQRSLYVEVTSQEYGLDAARAWLIESVAGSGRLVGTATADLESLSIAPSSWDHYTFRAGSDAGGSIISSEPLAASDGGVFTPLIVRVIGPPEVIASFEFGGSSYPMTKAGPEMTIAWAHLQAQLYQAGEHAYSVAGATGTVLLALWDISPSRLEIANQVIDKIERTDSVHLLPPDRQFVKGLERGAFYDTPLELVDGAISVAGSATRHYIWYELQFSSFHELGEHVLIEKDHKLHADMKAAVEVLEKVLDEEVLLAFFTQDDWVKRSLTTEEYNSLGLLATIICEMIPSLEGLPPYEAGRVIGRVIAAVVIGVGEVLVAGGPQTVIAAKSAQAARKAATIMGRLRQIDWVNDPAKADVIDNALVAAAAAASRLADESWCFVGSTSVMTRSGNRRIDQVLVGDIVFAMSPLTGRAGWARVASVSRGTTDELATVTIGIGSKTSVISGTPGHPVFSATRGRFVQMGSLEPFEEVVSPRGPGVVVNVARASVSGVPVYNLEIESFGTYFVGDIPIWVHNSPIDCPELKVKFDSVRQRLNDEHGEDRPFEAWVVAHRELINDIPEAELDYNVAVFSLFRVQGQNWAAIRSPDFVYDQIRYDTVRDLLRSIDAHNRYGIKSHHVAPEKFADRLWRIEFGDDEPFPDGWTDFKEQMPAFALPEYLHDKSQWPGNETLHDILDDLQDVDINTIGTRSELITELRSRYADFFDQLPEEAFVPNDDGTLPPAAVFQSAVSDTLDWFETLQLEVDLNGRVVMPPGSAIPPD